jgi:hypothetical protein
MCLEGRLVLVFVDVHAQATHVRVEIGDADVRVTLGDIRGIAMSEVGVLQWFTSHYDATLVCINCRCNYEASG